MTEYYNSGGKYRTRGSPPEKLKTKECQLWENIRNRCEYLPYKDETRFGKYLEADSCPEWKDFQNFAAWFNLMKVSGYYHQGWQLDKDLLVKDNKIYSPETCVFLPEDVNKALNTKSRCRGDLPIGMTYGAKNRSTYGKKIYVNFVCKEPEYIFRATLDANQIEVGFELYRKARVIYIQYLANLYKELLEPRAYKALICYDISMED